METTLRNSSHGGKVAETFVNTIGCHNKVLQVTTMKRSSGYLSTTVTAVTLTKQDGWTSVQYMPFSDYNVCPIRESVRCTEKAILAQHQKVLGEIEKYVTECQKFYADQ